MPNAPSLAPLVDRFVTAKLTVVASPVYAVLPGPPLTVVTTVTGWVVADAAVGTAIEAVAKAIATALRAATRARTRVRGAERMRDPPRVGMVRVTSVTQGPMVTRW